jgi:hypothetical protein
MLEKMGWQAGKGLGAKEQGTPDAIKLKANYDNKGTLFFTSYLFIIHNILVLQVLAARK